MDENPFDDSVRVLARAAGRRDAMRAVSALGMAVLAALGLANGAAAKKKKKKKKKGSTGPVPVVRTASTTGDGFLSVVAHCVGTEKAVGGGARIVNTFFPEEVHLEGSQPITDNTASQDGETPNGWWAIARVGDEPLTLRAYALCMS